MESSYQEELNKTKMKRNGPAKKVTLLPIASKQYINKLRYICVMQEFLHTSLFWSHYFFFKQYLVGCYTYLNMCRKCYTGLYAECIILACIMKMCFFSHQQLIFATIKHNNQTKFTHPQHIKSMPIPSTLMPLVFVGLRGVPSLIAMLFTIRDKKSSNVISMLELWCHINAAISLVQAVPMIQNNSNFNVLRMGRSSMAKRGLFPSQSTNFQLWQRQWDFPLPTVVQPCQ